MYGGIQVPSIDHQAARHEFSRSFPINFSENIPLGAHHRRIDIPQGFVWILVVGHLGQERLGPRNSFGIAGVHLSSLAKKLLDHFQCRRKPNIVRVRFERQAQHGDALPFNDPQRLPHFVEKTFNALLVDALRRFENIEVYSYRARKMDKGLYVLRKTKPANGGAGRVRSGRVLLCTGH